ncbi:hypothetical protein DINM_006332 [Dirofilaria immitis]|nr:hypothetical protein [Dirofilaria immitis]
MFVKISPCEWGIEIFGVGIHQFNFPNEGKTLRTVVMMSEVRLFISMMNQMIRIDAIRKRTVHITDIDVEEIDDEKTMLIIRTIKFNPEQNPMRPSPKHERPPYLQHFIIGTPKFRNEIAKKRAYNKTETYLNNFDNATVAAQVASV